MRQFYYTKVERKSKYAMDVTINVYVLTRGGLSRVGQRDYNTGSTKGEDSEALCVLHDYGFVSKKAYEKSRGYYERTNGKFLIHLLR